MVERMRRPSVRNSVSAATPRRLGYSCGPMKAVITGGNGFLGRALAQRLAAERVEIILLTRPGSQRIDLPGVPVTWREGDITDPATLVHAFDGAEGIIHAAGMLGRAGVSDETYRRVNAEGTRHVLAAVGEALAAGRLPPGARVLHVSSAGVLGPLPPGDTTTVFDEAFPVAPSNGYERSKALAEQYVAEFVAGGLPVVVARPEFVYGRGDMHVLGLFRAIQRGAFFYIGDGRNDCHPTYVTDAADGLVLALQRGTAGEVYQITGLRPVSFRELAETVASELGVTPPRFSVPRPLALAGATALEGVGRLSGRDVPLSRTGVAFFSESRRFTWAKAQQALGYAPQVELPEGVARTVAWYRANGQL